MGAITACDVAKRTQFLMDSWENPKGSIAATDDDIRTIAIAQLQCEAFERQMASKAKEKKTVMCVLPKESIMLTTPINENPNLLIGRLLFCIAPNGKHFVMVARDWTNETEPKFVLEGKERQFTLADQSVMDPATKKKYRALQGVDYSSFGFIRADDCFVSPLHHRRITLEHRFRKINPPTLPKGITTLSFSQESWGVLAFTVGFALTCAKTLDTSIGLFSGLSLGLGSLWNVYNNTAKNDYDSKLAAYQVYSDDKAKREKAIAREKAQAETLKTHKIIRDYLGILSFALVTYVANALSVNFCSAASDGARCKTANISICVFASLTTIMAVFLCCHSYKKSR